MVRTGMCVWLRWEGLLYRGSCVGGYDVGGCCEGRVDVTNVMECVLRYIEWMRLRTIGQCSGGVGWLVDARVGSTLLLFTGWDCDATSGQEDKGEKGRLIGVKRTETVWRGRLRDREHKIEP